MNLLKQIILLPIFLCLKYCNSACISAVEVVMVLHMIEVMKRIRHIVARSIILSFVRFAKMIHNQVNTLETFFNHFVYRNFDYFSFTCPFTNMFSLAKFQHVSTEHFEKPYFCLSKSSKILLFVFVYGHIL